MRTLRSCTWFLGLVLSLAVSIPGAVDRAWAFDSPVTAAVDRAVALSKVAAAQAEAGDMAGARETAALALETAKSITVAQRRAQALSAVASAQAKAGDIAGALETASSITDIYYRALALVEVAQAQAELGDPAARQTAALASDAAKRIAVTE